jgi:hypothetical protein
MGFTIPPKPDNSNDQPGLWSARHSTDVSLQPGDEVSDSEGIRSTLIRHFAAEINTKYTDLLLIICGFVSGLVDGLCFNAWGSFASMQTGP